MARGRLLFRERDLTRAIRAALKAGMKIERAWIEADGKIMLAFAKPIGTVEPDPPHCAKEIVL